MAPADEVRVSVAILQSATAPGAIAAPRRVVTDASRGRRVWMLLAAVLIMQLNDLHWTLWYMRTIGLVELNPVARAIALSWGGEGLVALKAATFGLSAAILLSLRRRAAAERGAWVCVAALGLLTIHWLRYHAHAPKLACLAGDALLGGEAQIMLIRLS